MAELPRFRVHLASSMRVVEISAATPAEAGDAVRRMHRGCIILKIKRVRTIAPALQEVN